MITGAFGFVGTNLSAYLAVRGYEVWALDVCAGSSKVLKCESSKVEGTFRQEAKAQRRAYTRSFSWEELDRIPWGEVDAVVHLAGKAHDTRNTSDAKSYFDINVGLTKKVIEKFSRKDAKAQRVESEDQRTEDGCGSTNERMNSRTYALPKFIFFSSVKAVADRVEGVLTEEAVPDPKTPYGQSKLEAEKEVLKFGSSEVRESETENEAREGEVLKFGSSEVRESGETTANNANENNFRTLELSNFRTYILRPCMIHGPGNKGNLNLLYGVVSKGVPWPLGAFENKRSFASIGNVCAVVEGLLAGKVESGVYQVADDEALSTNELIGLMAESMGRRERIWKVPAGWVCTIARLGDVLRLPLNSERLKKLTESYVASNAKVKRALGWERMPVEAREGMRKTLRSFGK